MVTIGDKLKEFWLRDGVGLLPGATDEQIRSFEERFDVRLPMDLKDYFITANGFDDAKTWCDSNNLTFLPLEEVVPLSNEWSNRPEANSYFIFADFLISSHVYAIRLGTSSASENPVYVAYNNDPIQIAESFSKFAEGYIEEDPKILFPQ